MEWLNEYQGAVIAVLTVILVLVNICYCIFLYMQNSQSKKQLELLREQWEKSQTPILKFECFVTSTYTMHIEVDNLSLIPIESLTLECDSKITNIITGKNTINILSIYKKGIYLPPNANRGFSLEITPQKVGKSILNFKIKYSWYLGKSLKFEEQIVNINPESLPVKASSTRVMV